MVFPAFKIVSYVLQDISLAIRIFCPGEAPRLQGGGILRGSRKLRAGAYLAHSYGFLHD